VGRNTICRMTHLTAINGKRTEGDSESDSEVQNEIAVKGQVTMKTSS